MDGRSITLARRGLEVDHGGLTWSPAGAFRRGLPPGGRTPTWTPPSWRGSELVYRVESLIGGPMF